MSADIIQTVPFLQNPVITAVLLTTPAINAPVVIQTRRTATATPARADILLPVLTDTAVHLIKDVPAVYKAVLNAISARAVAHQQLPHQNHLTPGNICTKPVGACPAANV